LLEDDVKEVGLRIFEEFLPAFTHRVQCRGFRGSLKFEDSSLKEE
jgi:hypothetical protein